MIIRHCATIMVEYTYMAIIKSIEPVMYEGSSTNIGIVMAIMKFMTILFYSILKQAKVKD